MNSPSPAWEQKSGKGPTGEHEVPQIPTTVSHFVFVPYNNGSTLSSVGFSAPGSSPSAGPFEPLDSPNASSSATSTASLTLGSISFSFVSSRRQSKRPLGSSLANRSLIWLDLRAETKAPGFRPVWTQIPEPAYETGQLLLQNRTLVKRMSCSSKRKAIDEREREKGRKEEEKMGI